MKVSSRSDPVWRYPRAVLDGKVVACEKVKNEVKRFVSDWERMERGEGLYWFDASGADDFQNFTRAVCKVHDAVSDEMVPFVQMDWQAFRTRQLFGWKLKEGVADPLDRLANTRRFRKWYMHSGKGAGKGPIAAAIILYFLLRDSASKHTSGVVCADSEPQARAVMDDIRAMMDADSTGRLKKRLALSSTESTATVWLRLKKVDGFDRTGAIKTVGNTISPERVSGAKHNILCLDEFQAYRSRAVMGRLIAGPEEVHTAARHDSRERSDRARRIRLPRVRASR